MEKTKIDPISRLREHLVRAFSTSRTEYGRKLTKNIGHGCQSLYYQTVKSRKRGTKVPDGTHFFSRSDGVSLSAGVPYRSD